MHLKYKTFIDNVHSVTRPPKPYPEVKMSQNVITYDDCPQNSCGHKTKNTHTHTHSPPRSAHCFPTGAEGDQVATLFFLPPPLLLPASLFLKLMPATAALETFLTWVCMCVRGWAGGRGGSLITRQGTLISDGNIWFTLSWRDSCIKSRNYPNQFKLHPPPSPPPCFTSLHIKLPH